MACFMDISHPSACKTGSYGWRPASTHTFLPRLIWLQSQLSAQTASTRDYTKLSTWPSPMVPGDWGVISEHSTLQRAIIHPYGTDHTTLGVGSRCLLSVPLPVPPTMAESLTYQHRITSDCQTKFLAKKAYQWAHDHMIWFHRKPSFLGSRG